MRDQNGCHLYILRCADGSYYTGTTRRDPATRESEHNAGMPGSYTEPRRPVELVFVEHFESIRDAIAAERRVKGWSRVKKEAIVAGRYDLLPALSKRKPR